MARWQEEQHLTQHEGVRATAKPCHEILYSSWLCVLVWHNELHWLQSDTMTFCEKITYHPVWNTQWKWRKGRITLLSWLVQKNCRRRKLFMARTRQEHTLIKRGRCNKSTVPHQSSYPLLRLHPLRQRRLERETTAQYLERVLFGKQGDEWRKQWRRKAGSRVRISGKRHLWDRTSCVSVCSSLSLPAFLWVCLSLYIAILA